jgi:hypothetical protein
VSWAFEKINEFKTLVYSQTEEGDFHRSKHKILILLFYFGSFVLIFLHFANIPQSVIETLQASAQGEGVIPSSPRLGLAILFYLYITLVAIITIIKGGSLPNFFSRPQLPSLRRRYKILLVILVLFFSGLVITIAYIAIFFSGLLIIYIGPFLYIIWTVLEPYFLLSGILAIIRIIDVDYQLIGFSKKGKRALLIFFILGYLIPIIFFIFLVATATGTDFSEITLFETTSFETTFSFYQPALASFSETLSSVLSLTLLFLIIWWIKDRFRGKSDIREKKKGMLPWFLGLTLLIIIITVVPLIATTSGSLQEITSILDLVGLFAAVIMGLWNTLGIEQITEPLEGIKRINPLEVVSRMHPYTKALFLLVISIFAFYSSLESSTIAFITGYPDTLKLQQLNLLAAFIGLAYLFILWRYKGQPRSTTPGLLKSTRRQLDEGVSMIKSFISRDRITDKLEFMEEE